MNKTCHLCGAEEDINKMFIKNGNYYCYKHNKCCITCGGSIVIEDNEQESRTQCRTCIDRSKKSQ